jgi:hypothetical protein
MSANTSQNCLNEAPQKLDVTKLFGFARISGTPSNLEHAVGVAYNKRGSETPATISLPTVGVPGVKNSRM